MKSFTSLGIFVAIVCSYFILAKSENSNVLPNMQPGWSDEVDWNLFKVFLSKNATNIIFSPISLKLVLALLYEGSSGSTENELKYVMHYENKTTVRNYYNNLIKILKQYNPEYDINLESRIFLDNTVQPLQPYSAKAGTYYNTSIELLNFIDREGSSKKINQWVNNATRGKISKLVSADDLEKTVMLIINTIYFKGFWDVQFPKKSSYTSGFYVNPDNIISVDYMTNTGMYYYGESKQMDCKLLRIPYKNNKYSFVALLPNTKAGLETLIKTLNVNILEKNLNLMDQLSVEVILPKFNLDFQSSFANILQDYGLTQMFENSASFPGIARGSNLLVTDILQKAGIQVNEEGSVAFAASEVQLGNKFGEVEYSFNATHPFAFFIQEHKTGSVLFVGKVKNPLGVEPIFLPNRLSKNDTQMPISNLQPGASQYEAQVPTLNNNAPPLHLNPIPSQVSTFRFNLFDMELFKEVAKSKSNVFISPASIKTTLGMILEGAIGKAADEISASTGIPVDQNHSEIREKLRPLLYSLSDRGNNTLIQASNGIFVSDKYEIVLIYRQILEQFYRAFAKTVDFRNADRIAFLINNWVRNSTHGLISEIVTPDNFRNDATMVIINALYFKGLWKNAFDEQRISVKCFSTPTKDCHKVNMMQNIDLFNYKFAGELDSHVVELPYDDNKYAMLIVVPRTKKDIQLLVRDLQQFTLDKLLDDLRESEVFLELPKFTVEYETDLSIPLQNLGIQEIFRNGANLSGIVKQGYVHVSNIVHRTKIDVNERGTVAAAATGAIVIPLMGSSRPRVIVDHPFVFFIYNKKYHNIVFEGFINEPTEAIDLKQRSQFVQSDLQYPINLPQNYPTPNRY